MEWHVAINRLEPHVVRILTPDGSGTGWLVSSSKTSSLRAIATAAHVIDHAHFWEEPIRLFHPSSGKTVLLKPDQRAINVDAQQDVASIVFQEVEFEFPPEPYPLIPKSKFTKPGVEIGWLGFPAILRAGLCFFSGRISAYLHDDSMYLVDGVAINGVSGGPAFRLEQDNPLLMGVVSAYIPNRATGDVLPGVAVVRNAGPFHDVAERFHSFDEAKSQETQPTEPPPQPVNEAETPSRGPRQAP